MATLLERTMPHMHMLFKRKGSYRKVGQEFEEDADTQRDCDHQILDAEEVVGSPAEQAQNATAETAAVPTATLLAGTGVASDSQGEPAAAKSTKQPKGLLGCLHFSSKSDLKANAGLPTAFNNRQSILRRLARSAKKPAPQVVVKAPKPPKKSPFALHAAAWRTNLNELRDQLATGADIAKRDKAGLTSLHYAAWQGSVDAVELLLEQGANVNVADPEGMLPLHFAAWFNRLDVAALLLDKGSLINPPTKGGQMWPTTPLIYAAKMGHTDMVALLMDRGAEVAATYKAASSALHEAAWGGHADVVAEMMRRNVSHDLATSKSKYRALHLAAMSGSAGVVGELLQKGAWVDARSQLGRTPLHLACEKGHMAAAAALVAGGADLLAKDRSGFTPLHLAVDNNHVQLAKLLLDKGATPDAADAHGALPLNFAHDPDFFKLLRAVRWYGAASVPSGNNPNSSRYISTDTASSGDTAAAAAVAEPAAAASSVAGAAAKSSPSQTAGGWIKAHLPHIRSRPAAVAAAAAQPGSCTLITPATISSAAAASSIIPEEHEPAAAAGSGRVSPAGSARSGESAAAQAAAATLARAAVEAVVARAAAEAALEEIRLHDDATGPENQAGGSQAPAHPVAASAAGATDGPAPEGAGGGYMNRERDSTDDARLLQQIRSALNAGASLTGAAGSSAASPESGAEDEDVQLEYYLRQPASIGIDAPSSKAPSPLSDGDVQVRSSMGDQAKHTLQQAATAAAAPVIPVSIPAQDGSADDSLAAADIATSPRAAADVVTTAKPAAGATKASAGGAAKSGSAAGAAAGAAGRKHKGSSSSKRKNKSSAGHARVTRTAE